ncbi:MAG: class I SAM-dependent methyltransferase [Pyrinomonadaceae bacterium]
MFEPTVSIPQPSATYAPFDARLVEQAGTSHPNSRMQTSTGVFAGLSRRIRRERRRRKVGRAYDMALEIARVIPRHSQVLDVGSGNGFVAHHLSALLGTNVIGIDLNQVSEAPINYRQFDGTSFPVEDESSNALLLCYVLHHVQNLNAVVGEIRRVLRGDGLVIVYEDIPACAWDRFVCWTHNLKWRRRTGVCSFRLESEWRSIFDEAGFELIQDRQLSRWRNMAHPVRRAFFLLRRTAAS